MRQRAPYFDLIFGPQTLHRLPDMLNKAKRARAPVVDISFPEIEKFDNLPEPKADGPAAYVSIMEGCSKYCTFCVVPYTRGEEVSRPFDDIITEVAILSEQGVREIHLLGQNVNAYRGLMHDDETGQAEEADLALLIRYVAAVEGVDRIRFTTSHPIEFSDNLIDVYRDVEELVSHIHLPVQSGSDRILHMMKRNHTALEYKAIIRKLKAVRPNISLSSDFIIGFPGETEADFQATIDLIDEIDFDHSYSFVYSPRPGTPASDMVDDVPLAIKQQRLATLQANIADKTATISNDMIGTTQRVLVERSARKHLGHIAGRTENNRVVNFLAPADLIGQFVEVRITEAMPNSLRGELAQPSTQQNDQRANG